MSVADKRRRNGDSGGPPPRLPPDSARRARNGVYRRARPDAQAPVSGLLCRDRLQGRAQPVAGALPEHCHRPGFRDPPPIAGADPDLQGHQRRVLCPPRSDRAAWRAVRSGLCRRHAQCRIRPAGRVQSDAPCACGVGHRDRRRVAARYDLDHAHPADAGMDRGCLQADPAAAPPVSRSDRRGVRYRDEGPGRGAWLWPRYRPAARRSGPARGVLARPGL